MLQHLYISNYALIESLNIDFSAGFSVITGETGAGKSIILGALNLLQGARADSKVIKSGERKCCVEATFDVSALNLSTLFEGLDIDFDGSECIIRREVVNTGKSRAFINDSPVTLGTLRTVTNLIIDIHSQHQNLLMGHETFLLETLDSIAGNRKERDAYGQIYAAWKKAVSALEELKERAEKGAAESEYLAFQLQELTAAKLEDGEQETLEAESDTLAHAEDIKSALYAANAPFANEESGIINMLISSVHALQGIASVYPPASQLAQRIESARIELEDINAEMEQATEQVVFDAPRQDYISERLDTIYSLEKKHRVESIAQLLEIQQGLADDLNNIENLASDIEQLQKQLILLEEQLSQASDKLTKSRKVAAETLQQSLATRLKDLGMPNATIRFNIKRRKEPNVSGVDHVVFLFSANKNIPSEDVSLIASGGEIARLMLALKSILATSKNLPTIIFDEIDTGVSGTMAERMARLMQEMSHTTQVICITHLPQIAAVGDSHYRVFKTESDTTTKSDIVLLNTEERIHEIANMLSGETLTEAALNNAKSLLNINENE